MSIKILIAEDDSKIANLIRMYLERETFEVIIASNGYEAIQLFDDAKPDLIILDIMMPGIDGLEVLKSIRRNHMTPVIILTARDDEWDKIIGLEVGADDYVTKPFSPRELVARVKSLWRRTISSTGFEGDERLAFPDLTIDRERRDVQLKGQTIKLTPKEHDLLVFLAEYAGRPFSRDALLRDVWDYSFPGDDRTVDVHVKRLRDKLQNNDYTYLQTVWGIGYKFEVKEVED
ncbi:MAG: response regulator transcription factor [Syntrophomonadaceae bacterium]|nr:response regulator transcription factor [Syntrophomonadaceae bacterium]